MQAIRVAAPSAEAHHYPTLRAALDDIGRAVHEEAVLDDLLADLRAGETPGR